LSCCSSALRDPGSGLSVPPAAVLPSMHVEHRRYDLLLAHCGYSLSPPRPGQFTLSCERPNSCENGVTTQRQQPPSLIANHSLYLVEVQTCCPASSAPFWHLSIPGQLSPQSGQLEITLATCVAFRLWPIRQLRATSSAHCLAWACQRVFPMIVSPYQVASTR
jgi:hypothetical protein